jgi:hypothetical protein
VKIVPQEHKNLPASPDFVRFKDRETHELYDAKLMDDGVIVRQCYPNDQNIFFLSFEDFVGQFELSYVQP